MLPFVTLPAICGQRMKILRQFLKNVLIFAAKNPKLAEFLFFSSQIVAKVLISMLNKIKVEKH